MTTFNVKFKQYYFKTWVTFNLIVAWDTVTTRRQKTGAKKNG